MRRRYFLRADRRWILAALALALLGASPARADVTPGDHPGLTLDFGGLTRTYDLHVPSAYDGTSPAPLVLDMHGFGGPSTSQATFSGLKALSDTDGYLIAY